MQHQPAHWIGTIFSFAIVALVLALRMHRMRKARPLKLERLWIVPILYGCVAIGIFWSLPPHGLTWLYSVAALACGAALGWHRGRMMAISIDPATHALNVKASPAAMVFILLLILLRVGARTAALDMGLARHDLMGVTDMMVAFALGLLGTQRLEMGLRARQLLRTAREGMA